MASQDCKEPPNSTNPDDCCTLPMMVSMDIIKECVTKFGEMRKKQLDLPGPKRGCVSCNEFLCDFIITKLQTIFSALVIV